MQEKQNFLNGLLTENPVFGLYLGICSALAISQSLNNALGMSISVIFVLIFSNVIISLLRKQIPGEIRIPVFIVVIATLVTIVEMLLNAFAVQLAAGLGSFIALIVVNCIILGRAEAFASRNPVGASLMDGLGMGIGYTCSIVTIAVIREILATGSLKFVNLFSSELLFELKLLPKAYVIDLFGQPLGAFITFSCLAALVAYLNAKKTKGGKS